MFYPVDSLKRGGRFYLCWVADSWPLRFATITHRQLWSQDVRKICDDLLNVMTNESGRATNRFSLRLSSQLMRGLVRLYQKKVTVFLGELCMLNAHVIKNTNRKWTIHKVAPTSVAPQQLLIEDIPQVLIQEEPENEQRIEEMIQNSGNVVSNIQEITLKEAAIPDHPQPINDGFGEENPEQAMPMLAERTLEFMLQAEGSAIQHSGLELVDKSQDKSHDKTQDKSRLALDPQMERISEHDVSMFGGVTGEGVLPVPDIEKEIPDIPEFPNPEPAPNQQSEMLVNVLRQITEQDVVISKVDTTKAVQERVEPMEVELEELEETEPRQKRRKFKNKLIIDKNTKLSGNFLRARISNIAVELRCEDSADDIVDLRVPWDVYFSRPTHAGDRVSSNLNLDITRLFIRNLGVVGTRTLPEREMEEARERHRMYTRSVLERIEEVEEPTAHDKTQAPQLEPAEVDISTRSVDVTAPRVSVPQQELDISELPTQKLETLSQQARKRTGEPEIVTTPKRQKSGYISFRISQQLATESPVAISENEKENVTIEQPSPTKRARRSTVLKEISQVEENITAKDTEKSVTVMLQQAGLADIETYQPVEIEQRAVTQKSQRHRSESSETPLGSLDRTRVSLGDSEQTTDSKRFIRDQWGTEGTMVKILKCIKAEVMPVTVRNLIAKGPVIFGYKKIIAARCFTSMLKLKQHGFINVIKNPDTLEIEGVMLGPKFD
ncbi:uncharacterized protein LOC115440640 [Manduca sexta]|uniref:uncharacterized protein LOC115440640 n=1 Tax=Manduca sexta TaxID=7130 RepID=UPI001181F098|nr:uncharacterized protein LOC115440640 [Manduca sexta]